MLEKLKKNLNYRIVCFLLLSFNLFTICRLLHDKIGIFTKSGLFLIFGSVILEIIFLLLISRLEKASIEKKFLYLFLIIGFMYLFAFPINQTPDEGAHVFRAYEVSLGHLSSTVNDRNQVGRDLPSGVAKVLGNDNYKKVGANLKIKSNSKREFVTFDNTSLYSFICYIPQAIGIFISRLITNKVLIQLYVGRIFNFLCFTLLYYFAIKILPTKKEFLFFMAFLPITIQEAISLAPDCLTISASVFLFSYVMYLRQNKNKINKRQLCLLSLICIIISQCKIVYLPICLLVFLLPKEKFKSKKMKYITIFTIAGLVIVLNLAWLYVASSFLQISSSGKSANQINYILSNPLRYLFVCGDTFYQSFQTWLYQSLGNYLGWFNIFVPDIYILGNLFIFLSIIFSYDKNICLGYRDKLLLFFVYFCTVALIFTSLYVQWTAYKASSISGIQGRYFQPIMLLLPFLFSNINFKIQKNVLERYFYSFLILENVMVLFIIVIHYL